MDKYITEQEAQKLTGYKRTSLYTFRKKGLVRWSHSHSRRKISYHKGDVMKLIGNTSSPDDRVCSSETLKEQRKKITKKEFVSVSEASEIFSVHRCTLRRIINKFKINLTKRGRHAVIKLNDLKAAFKRTRYLGGKVSIPKKRVRIKLFASVEWKGFKEVKLFPVSHVKKQKRWIKGYFKPFKKNLKQKKRPDFVSWGAFKYVASKVLLDNKGEIIQFV